MTSEFSRRFPDSYGGKSSFSRKFAVGLMISAGFLCFVPGTTFIPAFLITLFLFSRYTFFGIGDYYETKNCLLVNEITSVGIRFLFYSILICLAAQAFPASSFLNKYFVIECSAIECNTLHSNIMHIPKYERLNGWKTSIFGADKIICSDE